MDGKLKRIVGLTGGMGAGKSTLVQLVRDAGIPVLDCDAVVTQAYQDQKFADFVGRSIGLDGPVSKAMVAQEITRRPEMLPAVERCVMGKLEGALVEAKASDPQPFLLIDAPMLFEMAWHVECDFIVSVLCPREIREQRVMSRPNMSAEKMKLLMDKQHNDAYRVMHSHFNIHNTGTVEQAEEKMAGIIQHLKEFYA